MIAIMCSVTVSIGRRGGDGRRAADEMLLVNHRYGAAAAAAAAAAAMQARGAARSVARTHRRRHEREAEGDFAGEAGGQIHLIDACTGGEGAGGEGAGGCVVVKLQRWWIV